MSDKTNPIKRSKKQRMVPFYFQHSKEVRDLSDTLRAQANMEFASFSRAMFNAGLEAKYGIKLVNNVPVALPEKEGL